MFTPETNYLVALEQHKDHIRNAERCHLQSIATASQIHWLRRGCCQLGHLLKTWGARLEQMGEASPSKTVSAKA